MERKSRKGDHELGPGGFCKCPKCDYKVEHETGIACRAIKCPKCKIILVREDSPHDIAFTKK